MTGRWGRGVFARAGATGLVVAALAASLLGTGGAVLPADPAAAADEATASAVTLTNQNDALVTEGAPFENLQVTVSQTKDLVSQGIRVSWKNASKSARPDQNQGGANFLQIAQCWGEDPNNPGHPDRRTCVYGGGRAPGSDRDGSVELESVAMEDADYAADVGGYAYAGVPFVATNGGGIVDEDTAPPDRVLHNFARVDGKVVRKPEAENVNLSANQFYTAYTTNEVKWAGAGADGSGSVPFEIQTVTQSTALGCGTPIPQPDGTALGQSCWLVIIPRGTGDSGVASITRSGLFWDAWEHHVAVKLEFKPVGIRCQIGEAERQLAGSELVAGAIASWQPGLCAGDDGAPFVLRQGNEAEAVVRAAGTQPSPLAFTSRPLEMSRVPDDVDPLAYAPVAVGGVAISFAIDREPSPNTENTGYRERAGLPFTEMNLTPRLVAKLLTASYLDALPNGADKSHLGTNPRTISWDPEFRELNDPEWSEQVIIGASIADAMTPSGRSDAILRVWEYVLSDPEARAWLDGANDGHGMFVNPWYSTKSDPNRPGSGLTLPLDSFPKADPVEKPDQTKQGGSGVVNLVTWRPYTGSLADGAYRVLRGDGQILGNWEPLPLPAKFGRAVRELFGSQKVIGLTTTPAAELYQTVTASLRNPAGAFVAPTQNSLSAAAGAMSPTATQSNVVQFDLTADSTKAATTAYPLTMPIYAAVNPRQTDADLRGVYANLIRYAVEDGQTPGTDVGELPPGYAPLPESWVQRALAAADSIERGVTAPVTPPSKTGGATTSLGNAPAASTGSRTSPVVPPGATSQGTGAPITTDPIVTGEAAGELIGAPTADDPDAGVLGAALPIGIAVGLAAALLVLGITRVRRRV